MIVWAMTAQLILRDGTIGSGMQAGFGEQLMVDRFRLAVWKVERIRKEEVRRLLAKAWSELAEEWLVGAAMRPGRESWTIGPVKDVVAKLKPGMDLR